MPRKNQVAEKQVAYKPLIIDALEVMASQAKKENNVFKARAYNKVISQLKIVKSNIHTIDEFDALQLEGIGKGIKDKVVEIISTGELQVANKIKHNPETALFDTLTKIYGVGPVKAKELIGMKDISIKSIDDLHKALVIHPDLLNAKQKIGLKYIEDIQLRIPRNEVRTHEDIIKLEFAKTYNDFITTVVGSYRRGLESSGDIDVLVTVDPHVQYNTQLVATYFRNAIDTMVKNGYITDILALGSKKCMAFVKLDASTPARRLDILFTPPNEHPYALLYFTGSDKFNIKFRKETLTQGYSLNEHGVKQINTNAKHLTSIETEKDIFDFFGITYVEPINR